jgi:hypothetical protein
MPTIIITDMSPGELFTRAIDEARRASAEIDRLLITVFEPGETREDRALTVAGHARVLAEAFAIIDSLMGREAEAMREEDGPCDCATCAPRRERDDGTPTPPHMN